MFLQQQQMSIVLNNKGPGTIEGIYVNGEKKWSNVTFQKSCTVHVGDRIEIDGKLFFKAKLGQTFYLSSINCTSSVNNFG